MKREKVTSLTVKEQDGFNENSVPGQITQIGYPAYMVNRNWEVEWVNRNAEDLFFGGKVLREVPNAEDRNFFALVLQNLSNLKIKNVEEFIQLNTEIADFDISAPVDSSLFGSLSERDFLFLKKLWKTTDKKQKRSIEKKEFTLIHSEKGELGYHVISCYFREGTLILFVPEGILLDPVMDLLLGREKIIRELMQNRMPSFRSLSVLVADLQNSVKISAELPPDEYFELISEIWSKMEVYFRKYHATQGKYVGDGVVNFFLADPESPYKYVLDGILCAYQLKKKIAEINREWKIRKKWANDLYLNIGIHEGREWFGYVPVNQFTALGDTVNITSRLSDFARNGTIWVTKHLISLLPPEVQQKIVFGIRRLSPQGELLITNSFSRIMDLVDLSKPENVKFTDIATISVAEIIEIDESLL